MVEVNGEVATKINVIRKLKKDYKVKNNGRKEGRRVKMME